MLIVNRWFSLRISRAGVWFEPPRWFPGWLEGLTCTHCRGLRRAAKQMARERGWV